MKPAANFNPVKYFSINVMSAQNAPNNSRPTACLTIGAFDGVHLGHQAIIRNLVTEAKRLKSNPVVVTFNPHPAEIIKGIIGPFYLTAPEEKETLLRRLGVENVIAIPFDEHFAKRDASSFINDLFHQQPFLMMLVGHDFRFGAGQQGDIALLTHLGQEFGFLVQTVPPFSVNGQIVSSSLIRQKILDRQMSTAAEFLGRWYSISGQVVHGDGRGRHIGIPTANLSFWPKRLIPPSGVYAARVEWEGNTHPAVLNIGSRPTFYFPSTEQTMEVHILDFEQEIYGTTLQLEFIKYLREEKKFSSARELTTQIRKDIQETREVIAHVPQTPDLSA